MTSVSLGDVLSRGVALRWPEAVAIIGELCTVLTRDGGPDAPIPDPMHILLTPDGAVTIRSDGRGSAQRTTPGRLLHALLASSDAPSPLRLFVSTAISSDRYESVGAFGEALAYYEVPGRGPLIQAACQRSGSGALVPAAATPLPVPELPADVPPVTPGRPGVPTWAIAAGAAVLGAVAVAVWLLAVGPSPSRDAATGGGETAEADVTRAEKSSNAAPGGAGKGGSSDAAQPSVADDARGRSSADGGPRVRLTDKGGYFPNASAAPNDAGTSTTALLDGEEPAGETIYSSASSEVQPPVPISPLPVTGRDPNLESTATIELVVDEQGNVARVRLISQPTRMQPMMLLSAAKAWTFRPALREGRPVKYRLRVIVPSSVP
jgi:hypothetical protein